MSSTKRVVISGAGPSGLLLACLLLKRNKETTSGTKYHVTLLDSRVDVGLLDVETELKSYRSWMIGLAGHGLDALREIPELYNKYVQQPHVGVKLEHLSLILGTKEMKSSVKDVEKSTGNGELYIVDRNFIVAAIARFMDVEHGDDPLLTRRYRTKMMYVDYEKRRALVRGVDDDSEECYLDYDLLIGADGARSVVREAFVKSAYDFEMDIGDIFNQFRAVHVALPKALEPTGMALLPNCLPHMTGIGLPMPDNLINISIMVPTNNFDKISPDLSSDNPKVVAAYFRTHFKAFELADYDDFAEKWIANGRWNRTSMVHCNKYHDTQHRLLLMGDAAHATSPSIGMGMNTALRDAQKFCALLAEHDDDLDAALPAFSAARVPEGNSLTDLAFNLYCLDTRWQLVETVHMIVRGKLHGWFPSLVTNHPQNLIGSPNYSLSDVYDIATKLNIIPKHRAINDRIRQQYFEQKMGMTSGVGGSSMKKWIFCTVAIVSGYAAWCLR